METDHTNTSQDESLEGMIWQIGAKPSHPYRVVVEVNKQPLYMEINTGTAVSLISQETWETFSNCMAGQICAQAMHMYTCTSQSIDVAG